MNYTGWRGGAEGSAAHVELAASRRRRGGRVQVAELSRAAFDCRQLVPCGHGQSRKWPAEGKWGGGRLA